MKKHKITTARNLLSVILAVVMLFMYAPLEIIATEVQSEDDICTSEIGAVVEEPDLYEVTERREENVKHFRMPDGTFRAVTYANPVHRMDDSGEWQDIDNRLTLTTTSKGKAIRGTSDGRIQFADSSSDFSNGIFTLSENGYSVSLAAISAASGGHEAMSAGAITSISTPVTLQAFSQSVSASVQNHAVRTEPSKELSLDERFNALSQIDNTSSIVYEDAYTDTDLEYILSSNSIKENIIVNTPRNSYSYGFRLSLTGLVAALNPDGSVTLSDSLTSESVYTMPAPYMYDSDGETSYDVSYTLSAESNGVYTLTVTADKTWINDDSRAFPVVIDPTLEMKSAVDDTYISSSNPNSSYGSSTTLWISNTETTLVRPILPNLPEDAEIIEAAFYMHYYYYVSSGYLTVGLYEYLYTWPELLYNWNEASTHTNMGVGTTLISQATLHASSDRVGSPDTSSPAEFDITDLVYCWYSGDDNHGFALKRIAESSNNNSVILTSGESANATLRPYFVITYGIFSGVYGLENVGNSGLWMDVQYNQTNPGYHIQQYAFTTAPNTNFSQPSGLFKICRINNTDQYVIRSMLNNELIISIDGTSVKTKEAPARNEDVPVEDRFYISKAPRNADAIIISPSSVITQYHPSSTDTTYTSAPIICANATTASGSSGSPYSYLTVKTIAEAGDQGKWELNRYENNFTNVILTSSTDFIAPNETFDFNAVMRSTNKDFNGNIHYFVTESTETSFYISSTDKASIDHSTGILTALNPGTVKVWAVNDASLHLDTCIVEVLEIAEGTYFISNNQGDSLNMQFCNGSTQAQVHKFNGGKDQKWIFDHVGNGYFTIQNAHNNLYLTAPTTNFGAITEQSYSESIKTLQQWEFNEIITDSYTIQAKAYKGTPYVATLGSDIASPPAYYVQQSLYTDNTEYDSPDDLWGLYFHKDYSNVYIGGYDSDPAMTSILESVENAFESYTNLVGFNTNSITMEELLHQLSSVQIFSCITHGNYDRIRLTDNIIFTIDDIESLSDSAFDDLNFVLYGACLTGLGKSSMENLVNVTYEKGAGNVLGFTNSVKRDETNVWMNSFMIAIAQGATIYNAMDIADIAVINYLMSLSDNENKSVEELDITTSADNRYFIGNGNLVLCPQS